MKTITAHETLNASVSEVALAYPQSLSTFNRHNIDFCCGGKRSFKEACELKGLNPETIWNEIIHSEGLEIPFHLRLSTWSTPLLIDYIIQNHHEYVREAIIHLQELLDKVYSVHGSDHIELAEIRDDFNDLSEELLTHMHKEEMVLFPAIIRISQNKLDPTFSLPTLESPLRVMEIEHESAGDLMKSIRQLTKQYSIPRDACPTLSMTYKKLEEFDQDLMQHIHVENNVLFERVRNN
jgi:regulator of cell morphogenesis and NO signaling